jgi:hypothetical protein
VRILSEVGTFQKGDGIVEDFFYDGRGELLKESSSFSNDITFLSEFAMGVKRRTNGKFSGPSIEKSASQ